MVEALARRTRVACSGIVHGVGIRALLAANQRTEGCIWPRGPMKPPTRAQYPGVADKKSLGCPTRRLLRHPMGDQDSRHRMDERHLRAASIGAHRETSVNV